jgi:peptidyl-prolyl cis-trans isomerase C
MDRNLSPGRASAIIGAFIAFEVLMLRLHAAVRRSTPYLVIPVLLAPFGAAFAQTTAPGPAAAAPPPASAAPAPAPADPVVAKVNGQPIYLSDLQAAAQGLPDNLRGLPPQMLFPMLLDQLIDGRALVVQAEKTGLDKDPVVAHEMQAASDRALQSAMLSKEVGPSVTDAAVKARFDKDAASKPPEQEIHASHILVANEADAKKIIAELNAGADFATLAKQNSTDPGGKSGGDLGWFKKDDMVPEFSAAAFALKPGEITQTPVHTQFGWHVIKLEEVRTATPPTFEQARDELRQKMIQEGVQQAVNQAKVGLTIQKFNMDGTPMKATDTAEPPPATKP